MTDIIASPAVKEAVKVVMEQQERLGDEAAAEARESQPIRKIGRASCRERV